MKTRTLFFIFNLIVLAFLSGCTSASTQEAPIPAPSQQAPQITNPQTVAEAEKLAGFDVQEPGYLPSGVSLTAINYQSMPNPAVTLQFKIIHETYGDMGNFFQITQEKQNEAPDDALSCINSDGCEVLQVNNIPVVYRLHAGGTEGLAWYENGFVFRLLRTAGEPNKVYKDELVKVVESMK